jgi:predicted enzyme related to lactoylglutathione lyase
MHVESYRHAVPSWVDHSSPDPAKAAEFYRALFGWDVPPAPPEAGGYAMAMKSGRTVAGIGPQQVPAPAPAIWKIYMNVDSADDIAAKVSANGGQVLQAPMDIPDAGRVAYFVDPAGGGFGVWEPGAHKGAGVVNEIGALGWIELITPDLGGAKAFYAAVFGWEPAAHGPAEGPGAYAEWRVDGRPIGGLMQTPPGMPAGSTPAWGVYFPWWRTPTRRWPGSRNWVGTQRCRPGISRRAASPRWPIPRAPASA